MVIKINRYTVALLATILIAYVVTFVTVGYVLAQAIFG